MEDWLHTVQARVLGGLVVVCVGVFLLFHCSSLPHHHKRRRRVHHSFSLHDGTGNRGGQDAHSDRKRKAWRGGSKSGHLAVTASVSIIITPPSPMPSLRSQQDEDPGSVGSRSDVAGVSPDRGKAYIPDTAQNDVIHSPAQDREAVERFPPPNKTPLPGDHVFNECPTRAKKEHLKGYVEQQTAIDAKCKEEAFWAENSSQAGSDQNR